MKIGFLKMDGDKYKSFNLLLCLDQPTSQLIAVLKAVLKICPTPFFPISQPYAINCALLLGVPPGLQTQVASIDDRLAASCKSVWLAWKVVTETLSHAALKARLAWGP